MAAIVHLLHCYGRHDLIDVPSDKYCLYMSFFCWSTEAPGTNRMYQRGGNVRVPFDGSDVNIEEIALEEHDECFAQDPRK